MLRKSLEQTFFINPALHCLLSADRVTPRGEQPRVPVCLLYRFCCGKVRLCVSTLSRSNIIVFSTGVRVSGCMLQQLYFITSNDMIIIWGPIRMTNIYHHAVPSLAVGTDNSAQCILLGTITPGDDLESARSAPDYRCWLSLGVSCA